MPVIPRAGGAVAIAEASNDRGEHKRVGTVDRIIESGFSRSIYRIGDTASVTSSSLDEIARVEHPAMAKVSAVTEYRALSLWLFGLQSAGRSTVICQLRSGSHYSTRNNGVLLAIARRGLSQEPRPRLSATPRAENRESRLDTWTCGGCLSARARREI